MKPSYEIDYTTLETQKLRLQKIKEGFEKGESNSQQTLVSLTEEIYEFWNAIGYQTNTEIDAEFINVLFENAPIDRTLRTHERRFAHGAMAFGLTLFGSTKGQAYNALCVWLNIGSDRTIDTAYKVFSNDTEDYTGTVKYNQHRFCSEHWKDIIKLVEQQDKPFPSKYPKAAAAYRELIKCVREAAALSVY